MIPIINKLQDAFNTVGSQVIGLPQIVVVGCQSSGKSSVLESFVGRDFLPRGAGIVTRRPLVLQLEHDDNPNGQEVGEFLHKPNQKYTNFDEICKEIIAETERITGTGRNVSPQPIGLKLKSPHVLNLTLVDLPGLVKNATQGQDPAIVRQIHDMVYQFIKEKNSLILAVTPANQDLANSDALRIAREVDPSGDRTIGVITKIDLMDKGTNARDILMNKVYSLKLGYVGVVNRSQEDINKRRSMEDAKKAEHDFFENSNDYSDLADRCGSKYLAHCLNSLLMEHIRNCMPQLRHKVQTMLIEKEAELAGYGENPSASTGTMNAFVLDVITKYLDNYQKLLDGHADDFAEDIKNITSRGGARISRHFLDIYNDKIERLPGLAEFNESQLFYLMKNHAGLTVPLFTPHKAFDMILFRSIEQLRQPSLELVDEIVSILFEIHSEVDFMELSRFNILGDSIRSIVDESIRSCVNPTKDYINQLIDNERSFINTHRPDFRGNQVINAPKAVGNPRDRPLPEKPAVPDPISVCSIYGASKEFNNNQAREIKDLVQIGTKYFEIVREQIKDIVPKAVVQFLVKRSTELLRPKMIENIFNTPELKDLLTEDPSITSKRVACQQMVQALRKAQNILNEVRIFKTK